MVVIGVNGLKWVRQRLGWSVEVISHRKRLSRDIWWPNGKPLPDWYFAALEAEKGFHSLPGAQVVERTFAWLSFQRRLEPRLRPLACDHRGMHPHRLLSSDDPALGLLKHPFSDGL